jgi:hypothetical protein
MPAALQFARFRTLAVAAAFGLVGSTAAAEQIVVSNYA